MPADFLGGLTLARPLWLLLLVPCGVLCWLLYRRINHYSPWHNLLPAVMREALLQRQPGKDHAGRFLLLGAAWTAAVIGLSGPVWEGESSVVRLNQSAIVVVLDLSHNMLANDLSPTRLERARLKIRDVLQMRSDSQVALVAYAGSAHRVTPLSSDQSTLINLLEGLSPEVMPVSGSNLDAALELAEQIIAPLPPEGTQILVITGSVEEAQLKALSESATRLGRQLAILGAGTAEGAPVALPEGGFMRDNQGRILLPRLDTQTLATIARRTGASYHDITRDDTDLISLLQPLALTSISDSTPSPSRSDQGHWLVLLLLPLAALGARRGWLGLLLCAFMLPGTAEAGSRWDDLWQRPDQQAAELLAQDQPAAAAERFEDPHWTAWALYQAGDYQAAAQAYERLLQQDPDNPQHHFDHGTALAMDGEFEDALEAYEQTLTRAPEHAAARHNRSRIEALLEEQARQAAEQNTDDNSEEAGDTTANEADNGTQESTGGSDVPTNEASQSEPPRNQAQSSTGESAPSSTSTGSSEGSSTEGEAGAAAGNTAEATKGSAAATDQSAVDTDSLPSAALEQEGDSLPEQTDMLAPLPAAPQKALEPEQKAALEQWLREVPDNPTDLLRRKFLYQRLQQLEERSR